MLYIIAALILCVCLLSWAGVLNRITYWLYTSDFNRRLSPRWYERNKAKIEAMKARGRV